MHGAMHYLRTAQNRQSNTPLADRAPRRRDQTVITGYILSKPDAP